MKVHRDINNLPVFRKAVITIGTFDGVHLGHRQVIKKLKDEADAIGGESIIVTFHPHPRKVIASTILGIRLINTLDEKIELLEKLGVDHLVVVEFTDAFANQPAADYVKNFLIRKFNPRVMITGYDHRFGKERKGDYHLLEKMAEESGFELHEISKHVLDEIAISSTKIREALLEGKLEIAHRLLGYEFFFSGKVVHGNKLGKKLGYPTANLEIADEEKIIPGDGIYAVYTEINNSGMRLKGMMSIGFRPTVDGKKRVIEVNIFDFNEEIYGETLRVYVKKYLREEVRYENLQDLVNQIDKDKIESLKIL